MVEIKGHFPIVSSEKMMNLNFIVLTGDGRGKGGVISTISTTFRMLPQPATPN